MRPGPADPGLHQPHPRARPLRLHGGRRDTGGLGVYDKLVKFAGAGATMPISSFGNSLVQGAIAEAQRNGVIGILTVMFELTSTGITAAIIFGF